MCDGNCEACGTQCPMSKIAAKLAAEKKPMEEKKMSEAVGGCHAGNDEKIGRLDERHNAAVSNNKCCAVCLAIAAVAVIGACLYINGKLNDVRLESAAEIVKIKTESGIRIAALEKAVDELKADCEQARRNYNNARMSLSRSRNRLQ